MNECKWFIKDFTSPVRLCTIIYGSGISDTSTTDYQQVVSNASKFTSYAYSCESLNSDRVMLNIKFSEVNPTPLTIYLIGEVGGSTFLAGRVNLDPTPTSNTASRLLNLPLPFTTIQGSTEIRYYPLIEFASKRSVKFDELGSELVVIGEHHHNVIYVDGKVDESPSPDTQTSVYLLSKGIGEETYHEGNSFTFGEQGKPQTSRTSSYGVVGDTWDSSASRIIETALEQLIANFMEEYIMANNSIQILGQNLTQLDITKMQKEDSDSGYYFLTTNSTDASDARNLSVVTPVEMRKWLVGKYSVGKDVKEITCVNCVNMITSESDFTVKMPKAGSIALVRNTNVFLNTAPGVGIIVTSSTKDGSIGYKVFSDDFIILINDGVSVTAVELGVAKKLQSFVEGDVMISRLNVAGRVTCKGADVEGDINSSSVNSNTAKVAHSINVADKLNVSTYEMTVEVPTKLTGTLGVKGASTLEGTLGVTGASTLGITSTGNLTVSGNAVATGNLSVTGTAKVKGAVSAPEFNIEV